MGIVSVLGGRGAVRALFAEERVEKFKDSYLKGVLHKLDEQLGTLKKEFENQIEQQVHQTFDALKEHVQGELGSPIEQTQKTLDNIRNQRTRTQTERDLMLGDLAKIRAETEKIETRALVKSAELREMIANN